MNDEYDFDPWETEEPKAGVALAERTWPKTLYDRALKRVPDVKRVGGREWIVQGRRELGDSYDSYVIRWLGADDYDCSCTTTQYGEIRAGRGCSHVLAVMISRAGNGYVSGQRSHWSDGGDGRSGVIGDLGEALPLPGAASSLASGDAAGSHPAQQLTLVTVPSISDDRWIEWDPTPLPAKFESLRPHQWQAVAEILEAFQRGVKVVWLDAPTGTGKSLVAELVRRLLHARAFYVCHSKTLQTQFLADFGYAKLLMGRSNYPTLDGVPDTTCEDCTKRTPVDDCQWCGDPHLCPYQVAKREASMAKLSVLNTAYFLTESNFVGQVSSGRGLGIVDECDVLEDELMGFVEFYLGERMLDILRLKAPKEGTHRTTIGRWFTDALRPKLYDHVRSIQGDDLQSIRARMRGARLYANVQRICGQVERDEGLTSWVRDVKAGPMVLKPVTVSEWGQQYVWAHAPQWLCMSATIISPDELSTSTGLTDDWELVRVPMSFPVENRRIIVAPVADMSKAGKENGEWDVAVTGLRRICQLHPDERILVHTVSYELARLATHGLHGRVDRPVLTYRSARERDHVLSRFRRTERAVLVAPSMDRGVDLAGEACRVVVVMKVPFPNLGDRQISERLRLPDGNSWYAAKMVRTLVQMTGRAVRSDTDWCVSYILDRQMVRDAKGRGGVLRRHKSLLPPWWREALVTDFPVRTLLEEGA